MVMAPAQSELTASAAAIFGMILFPLRRSEARMAVWPALRPLNLAGVICSGLYLSHVVIVRAIRGLYRTGLTDPAVTVRVVLPICPAARPILQAEGTVR